MECLGPDHRHTALASGTGRWYTSLMEPTGTLRVALEHARRLRFNGALFYEKWLRAVRVCR